MYNPKHFAETDRETILATIRQLGAAELVTFGTEGIEASFLPLTLNSDATSLCGHFARANQQWKHVDSGVKALTCWRGPDTYISPTLYPTKVEHGKVVPTWNFITIQVRGNLLIHDDPVWVEQLVRSLTAEHESSSRVPWSVDDAPRDYIESMLAAIVGVELQITAIEAKWKLSQNKTLVDIEGVIDGLQKSTDPKANAIASAMKAQPST